MLNLFAFLFGKASPDPDVLPGGECPFQAATPDAAVLADLFGRFDLLEGRSGSPNWEEDVGILDFLAGGVVAPVACSGCSGIKIKRDVFQPSILTGSRWQ